MKVSSLFAAVALTAMSLVGLAESASAQASRTWVSGVGDDANPCSRTAPCKTFAGAISKTAAKGEINCLDPGGFGGVTITKAITIGCQDVDGGLLVSGTNAIVVNAGINDSVVIRGLDIEGFGTGLNGIRFLAGGSLHVDECLIRSFSGTNGTGISFTPSTNASLLVTNSMIWNNSPSSNGAGVHIAPTAGASAGVVIKNTSVSNNLNGIRADSAGSGPISVALIDSVTSHNVGNGVSLLTGASEVKFMIDGLTSASNGAAGVRAGGGMATVFLSNSNISDNTNGLFSASGGQIISFVNNRIAGNVSNGTPTSTQAQQ